MTSSAPLSIGQRVFGGYVVSDKLGEGGMGVVYAITNVELNRKLALKLLLPQWSRTPQIVQRFLAEARAASAIRHPNIIEILDASQLEDGSYYMVMEMLEGCSLEEFLHEHGPVSVNAALAILTQVCDGLQAAHDRGIIHRDLKPANLFVAPTPTNPLFIKILDFGIAKLMDPSLAGDLRTMTNTIIGTPSYMSPEQARGAKDIDHRTDIYALAVIAYELLAGALPYAASSLGDLVFKQATSPPRDVAELRADLPAGWRDTIMSALATDPDERPQSAQELIDRLTFATAVKAAPRAPRRRHRAIPIALAIMAAVCGAAIGLSKRQNETYYPSLTISRPVTSAAPTPAKLPPPTAPPDRDRPVAPILRRKVRVQPAKRSVPARRHRTKPARTRRPAPTRPGATKNPLEPKKPEPPFDPEAPAG